MNIIMLLMELARCVQASGHFKVVEGRVSLRNEVVEGYTLEPGWVLGEEGREFYHVAVKATSRRVQIFPGQPQGNYTYPVTHSPVQCGWLGSPLFDHITKGQSHAR